MTPLPPIFDDDAFLGPASADLVNRSLAIRRNAKTLQPAVTLASNGELAVVLRHSEIGVPVRLFPTLSAPVFPGIEEQTETERLLLAKSTAQAVISRVSPFGNMQLPTIDGQILGAAIPAGFMAVFGLDVGWTGKQWNVTAAVIDRANYDIGDSELVIPATKLPGKSGLIFARYRLQYAAVSDDTDEGANQRLTIQSASIEHIESAAGDITVSYTSGFAITSNESGSSWTAGDYISPIAHVTAGTKDHGPRIYRFPNGGAVPTRHEFMRPTQAFNPLPHR